MDIPSRSQKYKQKRKWKRTVRAMVTVVCACFSLFLMMTYNWNLGMIVIPMTIILANSLLYSRYRWLTAINMVIVVVAMLTSLEISYQFSLQ